MNLLSAGSGSCEPNPPPLGSLFIDLPDWEGHKIGFGGMAPAAGGLFSEARELLVLPMPCVEKPVLALYMPGALLSWEVRDC